MFANISSQQKSEVWGYFLYNNAQKAKCNLCSSLLKAGGLSTKSMISHLQSKHKITVKRSHEVSEDHSSNQPKLKVGRMDNYLVKRESVGEIIARLVAVDGMTFNQIATSSLIRRAFKSDGYSLPKSPQIIQDYFINEFEKTVAIVTEKINNIKKNSGRFLISFDKSTSVRNRRNMNLNLHDVKGFHSLSMTHIKGGMKTEKAIELV